MDLPLTYKEATRLYPEAVAAALKKLKASRSKHRKADPATLKWKLSWCIEVRGNTFSDLIDGTAQRQDQQRRAMSLQERIDDECSRVRASVSVANNYYGHLDGCPDAIRKTVEEGHTATDQERRRVAALSDEERAAESQQLLDKLRGSPGFMKL